MACASPPEKHSVDSKEEFEERIKALTDVDRTYFVQISTTLQDNRRQLLKRFKSENCFSWENVVPPIVSEVAACSFCLSPVVCKKIYPDQGLPSSAQGHYPFLSTVLHLSQYDIYVLLQYFMKWYEVCGLSQRLAVWMFACLMCLENPICCETEDVLKKILHLLKRETPDLPGAEKLRMVLICKTITSLFSLSIRDDVAKLKKYARLREKQMEI